MKNDYVYGSTVEKANIEIERPIRHYYNEVPIKRPKQKSVQWTPLYAIMLCGVAVLFMVVVINNIKLSSEVASLRTQKGALTDQYESMVLSNDLYYDDILSGVDLQEIERVAVVELGMSMAEAGQIVEYSGDMEDYVKQYSDLPTP